jgi:hypothetical protein
MVHCGLGHRVEKCYLPRNKRLTRVVGMKLPRRRFLNLAAGAAALPAFSRLAIAYPSSVQHGKLAIDATIRG